MYAAIKTKEETKKKKNHSNYNSSKLRDHYGLNIIEIHLYLY